MTVTSIASAPSAQAAAPTLDIDRAETLFRAVSNALLFAAGKSSDRLPLQAVRIERDTEGTLRVMSTDGYRFFIETVAHTFEADPGAFEFSLSLDDAKQVVNVLKTAGTMLPARLVLESGRLKVGAAASEINVLALDWSYPARDKVFPKPEAAHEVPAMAFNPKFLADLGKLKFSRAASGQPAHFTFYGPNKPALIRFVDGPMILHMPVPISQPAEQPAAKAA